MADLADQIAAIRDRYVDRLVDLHDDYICTRMLWNDMLVRVKRYRENPTVRNPVTGTTVDGSELASKARSSLDRLRARVFKDVVAQFELFVGDLLDAWLTSKPESLYGRSVTVATLLSSTDLYAVQAAGIREAVDAVIADKLFGRPERWFTYLKQTIDSKIGASDQGAFTELKARRDLLEHHGGAVEATYLLKAGSDARFAVGETVTLTDADIDETYGRVQSLLMSTAALAIRSA